MMSSPSPGKDPGPEASADSANNRAYQKLDGRITNIANQLHLSVDKSISFQKDVEDRVTALEVGVSASIEKSARHFETICELLAKRFQQQKSSDDILQKAYETRFNFLESKDVEREAKLKQVTDQLTQLSEDQFRLIQSKGKSEKQLVELRAQFADMHKSLVNLDTRVRGTTLITEELSLENLKLAESQSRTDTMLAESHESQSKIICELQVMTDHQLALTQARQDDQADMTAFYVRRVAGAPPFVPLSTVMPSSAASNVMPPPPLPPPPISSGAATRGMQPLPLEETGQTFISVADKMV